MSTSNVRRALARAGQILVVSLPMSRANAQCVVTPAAPWPEFKAVSNCVYDVAINTGAFRGAGSVQVGTGEFHPITWRLGATGVVTGGGQSLSPVSDGFSIRSWTSMTDYRLAALNLGDPVDGPFSCVHGATLRPTAWSEFADASAPSRGLWADFMLAEGTDSLEARVEIAAHGGLLFEDGAARATLRMSNVGSTPITLGVRYSVQPESPAPQCAAELVSPGALPSEPWVGGFSDFPAPLQEHVVFGNSAFPSRIAPPYYAAASLNGPWTLEPPPTPPDRFVMSPAQYTTEGIGLMDHCFGWWPPDPLPEGRFGGAAIEVAAWYWGDTPETARVLAPGEEATFTVWMWAYLENPLTCNAGAPVGPVECTGRATSATVDGSASRTRNFSPVVHRWSAAPGIVLADPRAATTDVTLPGPGRYPITLDAGVGPYTATCGTSVEVVDTLPPMLDLPAPVVVRTSEIGGACTARHLLRAVARDACDDAPSITHVTVPDVGGGGETAEHDFGQGTTRIIFTARDSSGNATTGETSVTLIDDTPPAFEQLAARPAILWPPNHQLVSVAIDASAADTCDASPTIALVRVESSEREDGRGDGRTGPDVRDVALGTDDRRFALRAERDGRGRGRTYFIEYVARDASGNEARGDTHVRVPHDRRR